ncbi:DEAD/DEAH box helicase family protein [Segatella copri]|mgnify:FL=1|uniref:type I restriction endonuclease subunit R n=1 Tax=Segatella copri TaxID=165179 RepID=UPI00293B5B55|nr:DEAD/DEAH box helicase family protein [Segatella copri]MDV3112987.1 DEAD/DEAH box helicase family protein [Segatella copri]
MDNLLNETKFEEHIAGYLAGSDLYNQRSSSQFDIEKLCDVEMLEQFLRQQPVVWNKLTKHFSGQEVATVIREYNKRIDRGESILTIMRKGFTISGAKVKFCQFKPVLEGEGTDNYRLYRANRFSVVRQMRYSLGEDSGNELDLCILLNGIPLFTFELKNEGSDQNYTHGILQYKRHRDPHNRMLRNCLVHFVMDNQYAFMTTFLNGEETTFLPFNQETVNPPIEGEYPTAYMWRRVLQADSILDLLENFIKRYDEYYENKDTKEQKKRTVVIFPRFHQLRAVRKLRELVSEEGPGHNYLIQHSAGSGKTKTMAWLAHQLANMTNPDGTAIFDSIIMVTDRIVLNRNMAEDVVNFEVTAGTVKDIRKGSRKLADALNGENRIIISTVQKFAFALDYLKHEKSKKYAIIVDEAHTAIGNEAAKDLVSALSTQEDLEKMGDYDPDEYDSPLDALMAQMQNYRKMMNHISYFAFTATPKDKTYVLYGKNGKSAHDLYSMKQAIDEKFILDVTQNYVSYKTKFELIEKHPDEDKDKLFEQKKALKVIGEWLGKNKYIKLRKASMIVDQFMKFTINKINHQAKAMVVCDSRQSAADYKQIIDRIIKEEYHGAIKTLVAFSGDVIDSNGNKCTESNMNDDGVTDNDIAEKFKEDDYKILIVAEKFQTGFDQKLLHTMFVDRSLGGIQCIQTLSRLNRTYWPYKEDTLVVDFRNDADSVRKAFNQYYTETTLTGDVDTQRVYTLKEAVQNWNIFNESEIDAVCERMIDKDRVHEVPSILLKIVHERVDSLSDEDKDKYRKEVNRFVRQYGFLAQLMDFTDPELEKFYVFSKVFYKYLPYTKETLPMELMGMIDLDKLRIQLSFDGAIELEDSPTELKATRIGEVGKKVEDEKKTVAELLDMVNSPFVAILNENDKIIKQIWDELLSDPEVVDAARAGNSYDVMVNICKDKFGDAIIDQIDKYYHFKEILDKEKGFALTLVGKFVEAVAKQAAATSSFVYDEAVLKEKLIEAMQGEMAGVCSKMRSLPEIIDNLFFVLNTVSIPKLDGIDLLLKEALNNIYANPNITPIVRYTFFNSLVQKYEAFLKKLYFLIKDDEIQGQDGKEPGLADAIHAFKCLWNLKYSTDDDGKKFSAYLQMVRNWRNDEAHNAPCSTDEEVNAGIKVVVALYLYVIAYSITDLEMVGRDVEGTADVVPYKLPEDKGASYAFAAEEKHRD